MNCNIQKKISGEETIYKSIDNFPDEHLNSLQVGRMPLHFLRLKIGSPIKLLRHLNSQKVCIVMEQR